MLRPGGQRRSFGKDSRMLCQSCRLHPYSKSNPGLSFPIFSTRHSYGALPPLPNFWNPELDEEWTVACFSVGDRSSATTTSRMVG
jgi:hypothetical protein